MNTETLLNDLEQLGILNDLKQLKDFDGCAEYYLLTDSQDIKAVRDFLEGEIRDLELREAHKRINEDISGVMVRLDENGDYIDIWSTYYRAPWNRESIYQLEYAGGKIR